MRILVTRIEVPPGSTLGFGLGITVSEDGEGIDDVAFVGDARPLGLIVSALNADDAELVLAEVPDYMVIRRTRRVNPLE